MKFWGSFLVAVCAAGHAFAFTLNIITNSPVADPSFRLVSNLPYDRQQFETAPETITFIFTKPARMDRSYIKVLDAYGTRVDDGVVNVDGVQLSTPLPELPPGKYTVKWSAICRCDDDANPEGMFHFTVH